MSNYKKKINKLKEFKNEETFRFFLMDLLKQMGFKNIQHTHQHGRPEYGKDIIASYSQAFDKQEEWYAFIVKKGKIQGGTNDIETLKNQIKQCFEYKYINIDGRKIKINKVRVVANDNITNGAISAISSSDSINIYSNYNFWSNEKLIDYIDNYYADFWLPGDSLSKEYKKALSNSIKTESEIKELCITELTDNKKKKLLDLFIDPHLIEFTKTKDSLTKKFKPQRIKIDDIIKSDHSFVIEGDPGSGKSRLVNTLICKLLESVNMITDNVFPVKLKLNTLNNNNFDIKKSIKDDITRLIPDEIHQMNFDKFSFVIFLDSIDELYKEEMRLITDQISDLINDVRYRFVITARSLENLNFENTTQKIREIYLQNFNKKQVELYINRYFFEDMNRGKRLLEVLKASNILAKLPTTPLTITLISILYEDTDYEIPATLTDIYIDFTNILLGKLMISSKAQFIDLELKKRIFAYVSYKMLEEKKFEINKDDFINMVKSFLLPKGKGYNLIERENIIRIITNSGLLYIDSNDMVGFKHDSFLEYFASFEIFYVKKNNFKVLIDNFNDVNWQNSAIFYAGFSKDMPWFIDELISGVPEKNLRDWFLNVGGMGYISQALYMTDTKERIKLVEKALQNMVFAFRGLKEMTGKEGPYFNMELHLISSILVYWFNINFHSITLVDCLKELYENYIKDNDLGVGNFETGFKLFLIATTLADEYLRRYYSDSNDLFNDLIERDCFIKDPLLIVLGEMFLDREKINLDIDKRKKLKKEIKRYRNILINITREPAYRFSEKYEKLKRVKSPKQ
ncbi:MAG: NACHT domain-containing protein [bacterium]